jgi:hypothetical protein
MVSQRKCRLMLSLGLVVALALAVSPATASAVSTLTGETLSGSSSQGNSRACPTPTFSVSGTATGPYPGMFAESGTWSLSSITFSATFTITSGTTTITGNKTRGPLYTLTCVPGAAAGTSASMSRSPYTATIHTPNGNFHDEGTSAVTVTITESGAATLTESFTSSLAQPVLIAPTTKDQCRRGGWRDFPQFKSQGDCVSFVATEGKNPPSGSQRSLKRLPRGGTSGRAMPRPRNRGPQK